MRCLYSIFKKTSRKVVFLFLRGGLWNYIFAVVMRKGSFRVGKNLWIRKGARLGRYQGGTIEIGNDCVLERYSNVNSVGGSIKFGNRVMLGEYGKITGQGGVVIEDDVLFADKVTIIASEHLYEDPNIPIWRQGSYCKGVHIGAGTWVGINVTILQGTEIGRNCVIGAGSVVKGTFPSRCVIAGHPARIIKRYDENGKIWKRV